MEVHFDLLPLDDVERIEVIRGPAAVFGRNTIERFLTPAAPFNVLAGVSYRF